MSGSRTILEVDVCSDRGVCEGGNSEAGLINPESWVNERHLKFCVDWANCWFLRCAAFALPKNGGSERRQTRRR